MSEEQLERSILERKASDELRANRDRHVPRARKRACAKRIW